MFNLYLNLNVSTEDKYLANMQIRSDNNRRSRGTTLRGRKEVQDESVEKIAQSYLKNNAHVIEKTWLLAKCDKVLTLF